LDTATLLWDTASFFTATYTAPEIVHKLLTNITSIMIEFSKRQIHHMGETRIRPGHNALSSKGGKGISISDDNMVMVSPSHYAEFSIPYNEILASEFGGLAIHSCGDIYRQLPNLLKTKGLNQLDAAFSLELDPNPNTKPELFRDLMKDSGIILHARIGSDWPEILPRLYHPDLKLALVVPQPEKHEPIDKNVKLLNKLLQTLIS
jgi:hypothetical protein